jgi:hypothetical protein
LLLWNVFVVNKLDDPEIVAVFKIVDDETFKLFNVTNPVVVNEFADKPVELNPELLESAKDKYPDGVLGVFDELRDTFFIFNDDILIELSCAILPNESIANIVVLSLFWNLNLFVYLYLCKYSFWI